ncbi:MAG: hypothetical protein LIV24_06030 [Eubacterium sp.]|nr:hypothetical protein [Eubacterium sp.]
MSPSKAYQLILTPDDSASGGTAETPMPDGTVNDVSTISVSRSGGADYSFEIAYSRVGEYWYQVVLRDAGKQVLGTWQVHVTVYNGTDQAGSNALECAVALHQKTKTGDKTDQITAIDKNQPTPSTTVTPTPSITTTPTPGGASAQKSATNAKTGDSSNTRMWIITLSVSTALLLFFLAYLAGKQKRQKISKN